MTEDNSHSSTLAIMSVSYLTGIQFSESSSHQKTFFFALGTPCEIEDRSVHVDLYHGGSEEREKDILLLLPIIPMMTAGSLEGICWSMGRISSMTSHLSRCIEGDCGDLGAHECRGDVVRAVVPDKALEGPQLLHLRVLLLQEPQQLQEGRVEPRRQEVIDVDLEEDIESTN